MKKQKLSKNFFTENNCIKQSYFTEFVAYFLGKKPKNSIKCMFPFCNDYINKPSLFSYIG